MFNVHVNRSPCDGRVVDVRYRKGKFINALSHEAASSDNESNTIVLAEPHSERRIAVVRQIVGLIARRIICTADVGQTLTRGERYGMIKFGSRTELTIPKSIGPVVATEVGRKVKGGADILVRLTGHVEAVPRAEDLADELEPTVGRTTPA